MASQAPLYNQVAVVTGASRGIGEAIARKLGHLGARVVVNFSKNEEKAKQIVTDIEKSGGHAFALGFDVSIPSAVEGAFEEIIKRERRIDILVNNAGISLDSLILRAKNEEWQKTLDVNLSSCFYCSRAVSKPMLKARYGRIINVSSVIGEMGNAGQVAYAASKAGIFGLTKSLAKELGSRNVTVNAIAPGYIETDMTGELGEEQRQAILEQIPLQRLGTVDDISEVVAFLCLPGASYLTGQIIGINGGMYM